MPGKKEDKSWDLKDIERLIDLLIERQITEFEMERGGVRVRIKRGDPPGANSAAPAATAFSASWPPPPTPAAPAAAPVPPAPPPAESAAESLEGLHLIKSPIVGTYYASPAPNAPPFVKPGDVVEVGQVLCIIEAMKLMNDIESEVAGEVVRAYVESGQPVEYGQSLFAIKPSHKK